MHGPTQKVVLMRRNTTMSQNDSSVGQPIAAVSNVNGSLTVALGISKNSSPFTVTSVTKSYCTILCYRQKTSSSLESLSGCAN